MLFEEKRNDREKRISPLVQEAYEAFKSTLRTTRPEEKLKRIDKALAALKRASDAEKRWFNARKNETWSGLYRGPSPTPYSDMIATQKAFPEQPYIWAFWKKLKAFRKQLEAGIE